MAEKTCKKGYYYCFTSKKCKKIPNGWHVMPSTGRLMKDSDHEDESGGEGVSESWSKKYKRSIDCDNPKGFSQRAHCQGRKKVNEAKEREDHEVSMAQSQLAKTERNIKTLRKALGKKEKNIPAWIQAKITDTEHNMDAAAGYMENPLEEANKSGDSSLRDWFTKSRASDGTPGWVQLGGKYAGKPCAKQPGQTTKPKCGSSKMKADLSDKEEEKAFRRKNRKDKNPNRRGKAKNVKTESYNLGSENLTELWGKVAIAAGAAALPYLMKTLGEKPVKKALDNASNNPNRRLVTGGTVGDLNKARGLSNSYELDGEVIDEAKYGTKKGRKALAKKIRKGEDVGKPGSGFDKIVDKASKKYGKERAKKIAAAAMWKNLANSYEPENDMVEEKDACYKKVKSRYKIWPSAYASGALVKCRKVGAANWGNKSEGYSNWRDELLFEGWEEKLKKMTPQQIDDLKRSNPGAAEKIDRMIKQMQSATPKPVGRGPQMPDTRGQTSRPRGPGGTVTQADIRTGYNDPRSAASRARAGAAGYKPGPGVTPDFKIDPNWKPPRQRPVSGVRVPRGGGGGKMGLIKALAGPTLAAGASILGNYIANQQNKDLRSPKNEEYHYSNWRDEFYPTEVETVNIIEPQPLQPSKGIGSEILGEKKNVKRWWDDDGDGIGWEEGEVKKSKKKKTRKECFSNWREELDEDWQKVNKGDKTDGMSQKAVDAYRRENPGSELKTAVTEKNPGGKRAKRRKSFCARSNGQRKMHNIDCSETPDKAICKARKRWRC